ncbi:tetraspanin-13-like isoform X1 [Tubulanus polymorphus]|uniref:tetraspanin-13-like isoform X1 n=1 Tax=Tubulanus polymorphus TaxID=672921 RepID=UPI003DA4A1B8
MVCGGFTCSKNALTALNVLYIVVAFILIGVAAYGRAIAIVTSLAIVGGIIACGVFLLFIALIGLFGAIKHHQVLLFFYMIILFLLFLIQFAIACACIAFSPSQQQKFLQQGWKISTDTTKNEVQNAFNCCGFMDQSDMTSNLGHPKCAGHNKCCVGSDAQCCTGIASTTNTTQTPCPCKNCLDVIKPNINKVLKTTGGVGLFFSFTEILGVWLTIRYRNQKDPRANPSAFL